MPVHLYPFAPPHVLSGDDPIITGGGDPVIVHLPKVDWHPDPQYCVSVAYQ